MAMQCGPGRVSMPRTGLHRMSMPRTGLLSMPLMGLDSGAQFPTEALDKFGVAGKKAVLFFYGADDAPSCSKQIKSFAENLPKFNEAGFEVVGIRNEAGVSRNW